jgi:hypothetical protein
MLIMLRRVDVTGSVKRGVWCDQFMKACFRHRARYPMYPVFSRGVALSSNSNM